MTLRTIDGTGSLVELGLEIADLINEFPRTEIAELILEECEDIVLDGIEKNFDDESDAAGTPWPAHSPVTIMIYGPHPILFLTGKMRRAATGRGQGDIRRIEDANTLVLGVDGGEIPYAITHQDGDPNSRIPRREFMAMSDETMDRCEEAIADFVVQSIGDDITDLIVGL